MSISRVKGLTKDHSVQNRPAGQHRTVHLTSISR